MTTFRHLLCLLGVILVGPILGLTALAIKLPASVSGSLYLSASWMIVLGLITAPFLPRYYFFLILTGLAALTLIAGTRLTHSRVNASTEIKMLTLPQGGGSRWLGSIIDEQDGVIFGETIFYYFGGASANEHEGITEALHAVYSDMRTAQAVYPSPVIDTYLNLQRSNAFDAVVIQSEDGNDSHVAVVFLHGFMGNVTSQCWEIAQASRRVGAVTVCPSANWQGEWWQPDGESILRSTLEYLRDQGVDKFHVGGFSNGGFGLSRLASKLKNEEGISGLFFIDGIEDGEGIKETGLPVLIIQGTRDERMPASRARQIAVSLGDQATYNEIDCDHFVIMKQPMLLQKALSNWLKIQLAEK